ncbi:MAG: hypothetical protein FJX46_11190 [Alphaproteobacteria bacterium]|nr:hypothetical protein [Alphaproteobacteria bacterium]
MTVDEYHEALRRLGFKPTELYKGRIRRWDHNRLDYSPRLIRPEFQTPEARVATIRNLEKRLGIADPNRPA